MLGRHSCRHPLLLWNRGDSPLKVIVKTFEGHSSVRDQQCTAVAAQLKHSAGDYCFPQDKCVGISRPQVEGDET